MRHLIRCHDIVLDGVAIAQHMCARQGRNRLQNAILHIHRQAGRQAVDVNFFRAATFGLQEDVMPTAIGKAHDLVLDRRAIARTNRSDLAIIHRRTMQVFTNRRVRLVGGVARPARHLRLLDAFRQKRERQRRLIARLFFAQIPTHRIRMNTAGGPGLVPHQTQTQARQRTRQARRRSVAHAPARTLRLTLMHQTLEKCSSGHNHPRRNQGSSITQRHASDVTLLNAERRTPNVERNRPRLALHRKHIRRGLNTFLHPVRIRRLVALRTRAPQGRTFAATQHAELDASRIGGQAHQAAQGVDLAH